MLAASRFVRGRSLQLSEDPDDFLIVREVDYIVLKFVYEPRVHADFLNVIVRHFKLYHADEFVIMMDDDRLNFLVLVNKDVIALAIRDTKHFGVEGSIMVWLD